MTLKLNSIQESVLEELMQKSFGAQNLYVPQNYKRGDREKEPCDLTWFGNGVLVLFYLTSGKKAIEKQDEHNLQQANKWINYWKRQPNHHLKATNRFGDKLSITFKEVKYCVCISVISHNTGIVFHNYNRNKPFGFTCTVPETLIHSISEFHGTIIDLLAIIHKYSTNLRRYITRHGPLSGERLGSIVNGKMKEINDLLTSYVDSEIRKSDFSFIYNMIDLKRLSASTEYKQLLNQSKRQLIADYYSDMSAKDFILLALAAAKTIDQTDSGKYSTLGITTDMNMNWVVYATSLFVRNFGELFNGTLDLVEANGQKNLPMIVYLYSGIEGIEHRSPSMHTFPPTRESIQAQLLVESVLQNLPNELAK